MPAKKSRSKTRSKAKHSAAKSLVPLSATADRYVLYQASVQDPASEVTFLNKLFKKFNGKAPLSLREDFCGTGLLCAAWVKQSAAHRAVGVDLDPVPLAWGAEHNVKPLGNAASRLELRRANVLDGRSGNHDAIVALNFSYWIFRDRATMRSYFEAVRSSLAKGGIFVLDSFGGWEAQQIMEEKRRVRPGPFTYIWDQAEFNPIDNSMTCHIHFRLRDGSVMHKAFSYSWRQWSLPEICELLREAGFDSPAVYWEDEDEKGEGTGVWRPKTSARNDPGWLAYIVARA